VTSKRILLPAGRVFWQHFVLIDIPQGEAVFAELHDVYLDPAKTGVPWLLDPESEHVVRGFRIARGRTPADSCDPAALTADLPDLLTLIRERHFGLATGLLTDEGLLSWATSLRERLETQRPATWGAALGVDFYRLRSLLYDSQVVPLGEDQRLVATVDPRRNESVLGERKGGCVAEKRFGSVLCIRLRRFFGTPKEERLLAVWADSHNRHFAYERIVVDLRGNPGGSDDYIWTWIANHVPLPTECVPPARLWALDGRPLGMWNAAVSHELMHGSADMPDYVQQNRPQPREGAVLSIEEEDGSIAVGETPWRGRMLVVTDRGTSFAGESAAWMLRRVFGARLIGRRSRGCLAFGDAVPYLLPQSGLVIPLSAMSFGYPPSLEMAGIPVDLELDPGTKLREIANEFDRLWSACGMTQ
jgi:hypothetical protein